MTDLKYNFYVRDRGKRKALVLSYKDPVTGRWKQISKSGFLRVSDAKAESVKRELLEKVRMAPKPSAMSEITFGEFAAVWMEDNASRWAANTSMIYGYWLALFDPIRDMPMQKIGYADLLRCLNAEQKKGRAVSTLNSCITIARSMFAAAVDSYCIMEDNPAARLKKYRRGQDEQKRLRTISEEESAQLLAALKKENRKQYTLCMIGLYAGLRYAEIIGLTWDSIDLDAAIIHVFRQWSLISTDKGKKVYGFKRLKTRNSRRDVPIPPVLIRALREYRIISPIRSIDGRLFTDNVTSWTTNKYISKYCPGRSAHSMRHTYATRLLYNGVDVQTVAALLGDTVEIVISTYIHYVDDMRKNASESVSRIFG